MADVSQDGPAFETMMPEIDAKLIKDGVAIPAGPLVAGREISLKFGIDFPVSDRGSRALPQLRR